MYAPYESLSAATSAAIRRRYLFKYFRKLIFPKSRRKKFERWELMLNKWPFLKISTTKILGKLASKI